MEVTKLGRLLKRCKTEPTQSQPMNNKPAARAGLPETSVMQFPLSKVQNCPSKSVARLPLQLSYFHLVGSVVENGAVLATGRSRSRPLFLSATNAPRKRHPVPHSI